jgi:hypothetical protein
LEETPGQESEADKAAHADREGADVQERPQPRGARQERLEVVRGQRVSAAGTREEPPLTRGHELARQDRGSALSDAKGDVRMLLALLLLLVLLAVLGGVLLTKLLFFVLLVAALVAVIGFFTRRTA